MYMVYMIHKIYIIYMYIYMYIYIYMVINYHSWNALLYMSGSEEMVWFRP